MSHKFSIQNRRTKAHVLWPSGSVLTSQPHPDGKAAFEKVGVRIMPSGGGGGNRTPVQDSFTTISTCVSGLLSRGGQAGRRATSDAYPHDGTSACPRRFGSRQGLLVDASTLSRHRRFGDGPFS